MTDITLDPADRRPGPGEDTGALPHYVSPVPFDPMSVEAMTVGQARYSQASQWRLMWWRLLRHRVAVVCGFLLLAFYATTLVSEFLAPYALDTLPNVVLVVGGVTVGADPKPRVVGEIPLTQTPAQ